jgi:hypothetical protein
LEVFQDTLHASNPNFFQFADICSGISATGHKFQSQLIESGILDILVKLLHLEEVHHATVKCLRVLIENNAKARQFFSNDKLIDIFQAFVKSFTVTYDEVLRLEYARLLFIILFENDMNASMHQETTIVVPNLVAETFNFHGVFSKVFTPNFLEESHVIDLIGDILHGSII